MCVDICVCFHDIHLWTAIGVQLCLELPSWNLRLSLIFNIDALVQKIH